ncbi:DIL domain-containing protein [Peziza echinospora]|nr:DIL domain-containing protein [Peziza echinospora]
MDFSDLQSNDPFREKLPRVLPADLPKSLDDRIQAPQLHTEHEIYDAWQAGPQFVTAPVPARLNFNPDRRNLEDEEDDINSTHHISDSDSRLETMLAAQAALRESGLGLSGVSEEEIAASTTLTTTQKKDAIQKALNMAASNGDTERVKKLLSPQIREYVDVNAPDEEGTSPLIYASCFGHQEVVAVLLDAGANPDQQDKNRWSSLMWATTNRHKGIAKLLLDRGASPEIKSSTGRTAFDFIAPNSELSDYLFESGYIGIGSAGVTDDFYDTGLAEERFQEEMEQNELKRRMMMESAINLEVDLSSLGLDENSEVLEEDELDDGQEFVWDRCLPDQMFVFQEHDLEKILDVIITNMLPQRSASQKPVPANVLFLSARYAHYHSSPEVLSRLLNTAMDRINDVIELHQWDMTILAFWLSNASLLLYYLKKDAGLQLSTIDFQLHISELINEIFILILRDAERRMDKVLDSAMLDHETIPGFEDVHFQHEWRLFKKKKSPDPTAGGRALRPPSPKQRAKPAPRNITSLLSSTLFVLDLYDIHSVIIAQVLGQLFYWIGAELFNRILSNRKYLARTKAMQIRLNVSILEDWARTNNREPEHYESGSLSTTGESVADAARKHLAPVVQLLQWLQCFSSLGDDLEALKSTIEQLPRLTPQQLLHATKSYRPEVGEKGLTKENTKYLVGLNMEHIEKKQRRLSRPPQPSWGNSPPQLLKNTPTPPVPTIPSNLAASAAAPPLEADEDDTPENLLMDPALMLPFSLPTSTDMLVTYGAGIGGVNRERERKYSPSVPPEYMTKLDFSSGSSMGGGRDRNGSMAWLVEVRGRLSLRLFLQF